MEAASSAALSFVNLENIGLNAKVEAMGNALSARMVLCLASYLCFGYFDVKKLFMSFFNCFLVFNYITYIF
jgi:hypothetical protein